MGFTKGFHQRGSGGGNGSGGHSNVQLSNSIDSPSTTVAASSLAVKTVNDKLNNKADIGHNHDDRYNTKESVQGIVDYVTNQMDESQGKIMVHANDEPDYLENKVDNVTVAVEGNELKVKNVDGLTIGIASINTWLSGTDGNIQSQIDSINNNLVALTSGMRYMGKFELYADLQMVTTMEGGDLAVVLADENRTGGRSMYVYRDDIKVWDFIGEFTFSDEFIALKDTPNSYIEQDGKFIQVDEINKKLVFSGVNWQDIENKPTSTTTQIDNAVAKRHDHSNLQLLQTYTQTNSDLAKAVADSHVHPNKSSLDRLGINTSNKLTIDGVEQSVPQKSYFSGYIDVNQTIGMNELIKFKSSNSRNIDYDPNTGAFTLEKGKTYYYTVNMSAYVKSHSAFRLVRAATKSGIYPLAEIVSKHSTGDKVSSGSLSGIVASGETTEYGVAFEPGRSSSEDQNMTVNREYTHIVIYEI